MVFHTRIILQEISYKDNHHQSKTIINQKGRIRFNTQQNIVIAQISDGQIQHAVILDLKQITGSNLEENSLYETSLGSDISGTNPFTGNSDEVSSITNLFLWNNNQQSIGFDNANAVTMNLIYR